MNRKKSAAIGFFAIILLTLALVPISRLVGVYDPWLDYDGNGIIDAHDLHPLGQAYGTSGDPTRNVNVTNWPVQRELFPENLILRGTCYYWQIPGYMVKARDLLDGTSASTSPYTTIDDTVIGYPDSSNYMIYNNTYIYQKIPTSSYEILGTPIVTLTWNVTNPIGLFGSIEFRVYLGKISMDEKWTQLTSLGNWTKSALIYPFVLSGCSIKNQPINLMINANERLAIRILAYYPTSQPYTVTLTLFGKNTDNFIVDIPIVRNP